MSSVAFLKAPGIKEAVTQEEIRVLIDQGTRADAIERVFSFGDRFDWEGTSFEVMDLDGNRVDEVLVQLETASPRRDPPT